MSGQCKCGSRAINDDPHSVLCDNCWRDAEIERLRGELDECRRFLRELVNRLESDPVWWDHSLACEYWCEQAAKVAGGGE